MEAKFGDREPAQVEILFHDFRAHYPQLDVLVNNAGLSGPTACRSRIWPGHTN